MPTIKPTPKGKKTFKPGIQNLTEKQRKQLGGQYYDTSASRNTSAKVKNLQMAIKDTEKRYSFESKKKGFPTSGHAYYKNRLASLNSQLKKSKSGM